MSEEMALVWVEELQCKLQDVCDERDALCARVAIAEANNSQLRARARDLADEFVGLEAENAQLRARMAELEAPPVVPEGWRVALGSHWTLYLVHEDGSSPDEECARISVGDKWLVTLDGARAVAPWEALAALEYAHRTGQRPPHAGDE